MNSYLTRLSSRVLEPQSPESIRPKVRSRFETANHFRIPLREAEKTQERGPISSSISPEQEFEANTTQTRDSNERIRPARIPALPSVPDSNRMNQESLRTHSTIERNPKHTYNDPKRPADTGAAKTNIDPVRKKEKQPSAYLMKVESPIQYPPNEDNRGKEFEAEKPIVLKAIVPQEKQSIAETDSTVVQEPYRSEPLIVQPKIWQSKKEIRDERVKGGVEDSTSVRITIGRVDVRAVFPPQEQPAPGKPASHRNAPLSLEEYLQKRNGA